LPENTEKLGGLWVIIEQRHGKVVRVSLELLGEARALSDKAPSDVTAFLIGEDVAEIAEELIWQGADRVIIAEHAICRYYRILSARRP